MKNWKHWLLYGSWIWLYLLCAGLSHIAEPTQAQSVAMTLLSLVFFVPGVIWLVSALKKDDRKQLLTLRWICIGSLALTLVFLVANVLSALASEIVGNVLYEILIFVSVPMVCSRYWALSLFLWACLLFATFPGRKKK